MDLADIAGNVQDGIHIATIGGTWMAAVYGIAGMRDYDGHLSFNPRSLPGKMKRVRFPLTIRGQVLEVKMDRESVTYSLREGEGLVIRHGGEEIRLSPHAPISVRPFLKPSKPRSAKRKPRRKQKRS
jgi:alpha,alpha-trehalose phosphorylase